jgi:hypothetical protein
VRGVGSRLGLKHLENIVTIVKWSRKEKGKSSTREEKEMKNPYDLNMLKELHKPKETDTMFTPLLVSLASEGTQAVVDLGEWGGDTVIRKSAGNSLTEEQKTDMVLAINIYRAELQKAGINVPEEYLTRVNGGIEMVDEYIDGPDVDTMVRMGDYKGWDMIVDKLCDLQDGEVFLDAKPANWVVKDDELYFIDMYPPPLKGGDGHVIPWIPEVYKRPRELFTFNYGDTRGRITKLLASARFTYPDKHDELAQRTLANIATKIPQDQLSYIEEQVADGYPDMDHFYNGDNITPRLEELL